MKIKNLLCAAAAVSAFVFPSIANAETEKGYTLTPVSEKTSTSVTLYEYDKVTKTFKKVYNEVSLNKTTYGTGASSSSVDIGLVNKKSQVITINYDNDNLGTRQEITTDIDTVKNNFYDVDSQEDGGVIKNTANISKIEGDFSLNSISLYSDDEETKYGGVIHNTGTIENIVGDFYSNGIHKSTTEGYVVGYGGSIYNRSSAVTTITGDFVNNYVSQISADNNASSYGGAIYNSLGTLNLLGDFILNYLKAQSKLDGNALAYGGAIYNKGTINAVGNFVNNYIFAKSKTYTAFSYGGAIYNDNGNIDVVGDFIGNYVFSSVNENSAISGGGAIYSTSQTGSEVKVQGDFIGNYAETQAGKLSAAADGGAIKNTSGGINITGDFLNNYVSSTSSVSSATSRGGAIYNSSTELSKIVGNFVDNYAFALSSTSSLYSRGGAVYNAGNLDIEGDFLGNYTTFQSGGYAKQYSQGGAIYNIGAMNVTGDFVDNYTIVNNGSSEISGGAVYNTGTMNVNGNFINNSAQATSSIANAGAIYNTGTMTVIGDFVNNSIQTSGSGYGGAVYNTGTMTVIGDFIANSTVFSSNSSNSKVQGGAIYNKGTITLSGDFTDNKVKNSTTTNKNAQGGAIYNIGTVNINATEKDITFSGNTVNGVSNAIYNEGTVNFNAADGYKFNMNDAITGKNITTSILNINGDMNLNSNILTNTINLNSGTLQVGENALLTSSKIVLNEGATLDVLDGAIKTYSLNSIIGNGGNLCLDIDATAITSDKFDVSSSSGTINLSNINIINPTQVLKKLQVVDAGSLNFNDTEVYTGAGKFYVSNIGNGYIEIDSLDREAYILQNVVKFTDGDRIYSMNQDETVTRPIDNMSGTSLTINGNGYTLDGNNYTGIDVAENQKLTVNNVIIKNFVTENEGNGGFIDNKGSLENLSGTFENNTANKGGILYNQGTTNTISGTFENNSAKEGGILYNDGSVNSISGKFTENSTANNGGIINNNGTITSIDGDFKNNFSNRNGGIIHNTNTIDTIAGTYEKNTATKYGGVLNNEGKITSINGTFNENTANYGNVIFNNYKGSIDTITGTFNNNSGGNFAGAIYNGGEVGTINGIFTNNAVEKQGGVIVNGNLIDKITGHFENNSAKTDGGVLLNGITINSVAGKFINNTAGNYGGAIINLRNISSITGDFIKNSSTNSSGGAIYNMGEITSMEANFTENTAKQYGGAIYNGENAVISSLKGTFKNNTAEYGGAIYNDFYAIINTIDADFKNNKSTQMGGAIHNEGGFISAISGIFENNSSEMLGGAIVNMNGAVNIVTNGNNTIFTGNKDATGSNAIANTGGFINLNAQEGKSIIFNDAIGVSTEDIKNFYKQMDPNISDSELEYAINDAKEMFNPTTSIVSINALADDPNVRNSIKKILLALEGITEEEYNQLDDAAKAEGEKMIDDIIQQVNFPTNNKGTVEINNKVKRQTVNMFDGTLKFGTNEQEGVEYTGGLVESNFNYYGGLVTLQNGGINNANLGNMTLYNEMNLALDADLAKETIDTISADSFISNDNKINIKNINLLSTTDKKELSLSPLSADMDSATRQTMADSIIYSGGDVTYGNIYKYTVNYDPTNAMLNFGLKSKGGNLDDYNPTVASKPIIQAGAQTVQLDSYTEAFRNLDMFMLMPENERLAHKYRNKYASLNSEIVYDPTMSTYQNNTAWFRPYTTFENVPLKNGPKVSNVSYGTYFGYDSSLHELGKGWDGTFGVYAGYNGSHQTFNGNSVYQNGGTLGLIGVLYKGNFFTGWTINAGASSGSTSNMFGEDNFNSLAGGISTKNGYNFELADGKFIIQPSLLMSYSFINTFDYTNAVGVRMKSDPLHTLQIEPSIKLIGNIGTWQPYANVSMVWNVLNETSVTANNVKLPEVSVKPYVKYGVGLQKKWGDRFTGFGQAYVMNGGRNGVGLQAGLRIAIGNETTKLKAAWLNPNKKNTTIVLDGKVK